MAPHANDGTTEKEAIDHTYMTHNSYYPMSFPTKENFLDETLTSNMHVRPLVYSITQV